MKKILQTLRDNINGQITALASATGKEVEALRTGLQAQLASLAELDKLPEVEVNAAFASAVSLQQEHNTRLFAELQTARTALATATASFNELDAKVKSGELLEKAKVTERCELAKGEGVKSCEPEIMDLRKKIVAALPTPPDNILKLPTAEFATALTDAAENLKKAAEVGLTLENHGAKLLKRILFTKQDAFTAELAELKELGLTGAPILDPLRGGKGEDDQRAPVDNSTRRILC